MIKAFKDWETTQAANLGGGSFPKLPAGGYEAIILGAKLDETANGKKFLAVMVDITTGEFKDYYKQQFDNSTFEDKKWKGVIRYFLPVDNGEKGDNFKKSLIKAFVNALENSNPGYKWDWNEAKLKNNRVGILVGDKEWDWNGKHGFAAEIRECVPLEIIQKGQFSIPETKYLNGNALSAATGDYPPPVENPDPAPMPADDDYPF